MGVYIANMEKPKKCEDCHFFMPFYMDGEIFRVGSVCTLTEDTKSIEANHDDCPLIEIVQCKDCRYEEYCEKKIHRHGIIFDINFCSYGERRADG